MIDVLVKAAENAGVEYRTDYSGRGMYGAECFAIYGDANDLLSFAWKLGEDTWDEIGGRNSRTDNMGFEFVYYWPHLKTKEGRF